MLEQVIKKSKETKESDAQNKQKEKDKNSNHYYQMLDALYETELFTCKKF